MPKAQRLSLPDGYGRTTKTVTWESVRIAWSSFPKDATRFTF